MYKVSVSDINQLRTQSGAGMMECKKVLIEASGDFEKAVELLRKRGQKIAMNRLDRQAKEGVVVCSISKDHKKAVILSLNCETDFVAKNQDFRTLASTIVEKALDCENLEALLESSFTEGLSINEKLIEQTGIIGEKLQVGFFKKLEAFYVTSYVHHNQEAASLVGFSFYVESIEKLAKDVAMQVVAMNPLSLDENSLAVEVVEKEKEFIKEQLRKEGKPENIVEQITGGKLKKFYSENTLIHQDFVMDPKLSVGEYIKQFNKELQVTDFKRISIK